MKTAPLLRAVMWVVVFGGGVAAGFFLRKSPVQTAAGAVPVAGATATRAAEKAEGQRAVSFDGTAAGLLRLAKSAGGYYRMRNQLYVVLQPLSAERIGDLTKSFPWSPSLKDYEDWVLTLLVEQWAEKNPEAALRWAGSLPKNRSRTVRNQILTALAITDGKKAIALARAITPAADRDRTLRELASTIGTRDPQQGFELLFTGGFTSGRDYQISAVLQKWAEEDPEGAFARAQGLKLIQRRQEAMREVLAVWARTDPAAARTAALALPEGKARSQCLGSIFRVWGTSDPAAARAAAEALGGEKERQEALRWALVGWSSTDPAGAVEAAAALPRNVHTKSMLQEAYGLWAQQDPAAAAASATARQLSKSDRRDLLMNIASAWGQNDPQAAMAWARGLSANDGGASAVANIMNSFARTDGQAAAALWDSLPKEQRRTNLSNLITGWAQVDPDAALRFARGLERPQDRVSALISVAGTLDLDKPEVVTSVLNELPAGQLRVDAIRTVLNSRGQYDLDGAVRWLRTLPENERTAALSGHHESRLSGADPKEMRALLESTPGLTGASHLWASAAGAIAGEDPAGALTWAQNLESSLARRQSVQQVLEVLSGEDPAAALAQAATIKDRDLVKDVLPGIFSQWARQDADAVLAWAATASGPEREHALLQGTLAKADNDPVASAAAVDSLLKAKGDEKPGAALNNAVTQVAGSWFRQDIGQATGWALQLPAGSAQEAAVSTITHSWTRLDPIAASEWVQQLPPGGSRDVAAERLSQGIQYSDPESAVAWASSIGNEAKREEVVRNAIQAWMWQDRNAARNAIQNAPVSENVRKTLLEQWEKRE